jgi:hypothetical protein
MATNAVQALLRKRREAGASPFPHQATFMLDNPIRRRLLKPARVMDDLGLTGAEHVLELGPGPGSGVEAGRSASLPRDVPRSRPAQRAGITRPC